MLSTLSRLLADFLKEHYKDVGLLVGGTWALYNLFQRGSLHPLLDLTVSGRLIREHGTQYILVSMEAKNVHVPMVRLELCALQVSSRKPEGEGEGSLTAPWAANPPIVQVLKDQKRIWAGETLRDELLLRVPENDRVFRLEFRIFRNPTWYQQPLHLLSKIPRLGRIAPKGPSWYAVAIVEGLSKPEVNSAGKHSSRRGSNGPGDSGLEEGDRGDQEKQ